MIQYRYILDNSSKKFECPSCGKRRFVRLIDSETGQYIASEYGRCDRQDSCGYVKYPAQPKKQDEEFDIIKGSEARKTIEHIADTDFYKGLCRLFDQKNVDAVFEKYGIGGMADGRVIFYQYDLYFNIRTGKIMDYDPNTLKRIDRWAWMHKQPYRLSQVFFGLHLIRKQDPDFAKIFIVESEKTAILCELMKTDWTEIYIATGGREMINNARFQPLMAFKSIVLIPDVGCTEYWAGKVPGRVQIWQFEKDEDIKGYYPDELLSKGNDIGDIIIYDREKRIQSIVASGT